MLDKADGPLDDGAWAPVVDREVDPPQARQGGRQAEHAPHIGEPPPVDGLVVVTDQAQVARVAGKQDRELELRAIEVLRLVHEQGRAAPPPPGKESDVGWQVENYGTDPDIDVDNAPQDAAAGRDRQLERALQIALERVAQRADKPEFGPRPNLARAPLPPRR